MDFGMAEQGERSVQGSGPVTLGNDCQSSLKPGFLYPLFQFIEVRDQCQTVVHGYGLADQGTQITSDLGRGQVFLGHPQESRKGLRE